MSTEAILCGLNVNFLLWNSFLTELGLHNQYRFIFWCQWILIFINQCAILLSYSVAWYFGIFNKSNLCQWYLVTEEELSIWTVICYIFNNSFFIWRTSKIFVPSLEQDHGFSVKKCEAWFQKYAGINSLLSLLTICYFQLFIIV